MELGVLGVGRREVGVRGLGRREVGRRDVGVWEQAQAYRPTYLYLLTQRTHPLTHSLTHHSRFTQEASGGRVVNDEVTSPDPDAPGRNSRAEHRATSETVDAVEQGEGAEGGWR